MIGTGLMFLIGATIIIYLFENPFTLMMSLIAWTSLCMWLVAKWSKR